MISTSAQISRRIRSLMDQIVAELRGASSAVENDGLTVHGMTGVLKSAMSDRNRLEAALTGGIGALDRVAERVPDGELTAGLSCATWLSHNCQMSSSAAYAQVRLARQLPFLPDTARAFEQGLISPQHASVVARSVEMVARGEGDAGEAEARLLEEARQRDPRDLFRWGLSLVHELAPKEMEAEEDRRVERRYLRMTEAFDGGCEATWTPSAGRGSRRPSTRSWARGARTTSARPASAGWTGWSSSATVSWTAASCQPAAARGRTSRSRVVRTQVERQDSR